MNQAKNQFFWRDVSFFFLLNILPQDMLQANVKGTTIVRNSTHVDALLLEFYELLQCHHFAAKCKPFYLVLSIDFNADLK